jgi:hypothetical protein
MTIIRSNTTAGLRIEPDNAGNIVFITGQSNVAMRLESSGVVDLSNSRFVVPVGNTATRPGSPVLGMLRFNNQANTFEAYTTIGWANVSAYYPPPLTFEYIAVGGGGGGGGVRGGGGGGGGILTGNVALIGATTLDITIGAGGALRVGSPSAPTNTGNRGSNTTIAVSYAQRG